MSPSEHKNLVIYDGACGVCQRLQQIASAKDIHNRLTFIAFQIADLQKIAPGVTVEKAATTLIFLGPDKRPRHGARAFFSATAALPGWFGAIAKVLSTPVLSLLFEPFYRLLAAQRSRVSRWLGLQHCAVDYSRQ